MFNFIKLRNKVTFIFFSIILMCSSRCERVYNIYTVYNPVFMKRSDLEKSISLNPAREIQTPAKIYTKDNYLFVSEAGLGVHVIDNNVQTAPVKIGFIKILGCFDMAIKGSILYVDNATDLVGIDLNDPTQLKVTARVVDAFPEPLPPDNLEVRPEHLKKNRPSDLVLVKWNKAN